MANPLSASNSNTGVSFFRDVAHMREWCWERNRKAKECGALRWMFVSEDKDTHTNSIKTRVGSDARWIIETIQGGYPDFWEWDHDRLASEFRIRRHMAKMGMSEEAATKARFANVPRLAA